MLAPLTTEQGRKLTNSVTNPHSLVKQGCPSQSLLRDSYFFAAAVPASMYSPVHAYSNPPSAVPVVLQLPDPLISFIFPVPPVI